jgi:hypothetical protein
MICGLANMQSGSFSVERTVLAMLLLKSATLEERASEDDTQSIDTPLQHIPHIHAVTMKHIGRTEYWTLIEKDRSVGV